MAESNSDTWQSALTRRLRTLLRVVPLLRVEESKGRRKLDLEEQDLRAIALRALDLTIEKMGLGQGFEYEELVEELTPMVRSCQAKLSGVDAERIAAVVLDQLLNEGSRRRAFSEGYLAFTSSAVVRRQLDFHLLKEHETPEGKIIIKATTEAINLYAGMLEYPVEDAQIAEEAVLSSQVKRGRIADAVQTAKRARVRSIEYKEKIVTFLETSRRDAEQMDWINDALGIINNARQHIQERIGTEGDLITVVESKLDIAGPDTAPLLAQLRSVLDECRARHLELHGRLITANDEYLREHDRQAFRPRAIANLPDIEADILSALLRVPSGRIASEADTLLRLFHGCRTPKSMHMPALIDRLLAPRQEEADSGTEAEGWDLEDLPLPPPRFEAEDHSLVDQLLRSLRSVTALSQVLAQAEKARWPSSAQRLLVLRILQAFDGAESSAPFCVDTTGTRLSTLNFSGDDLRIWPPAKQTHEQ